MKIDLSKHIEPVSLIAQAQDLINDYYKYKKYVNDEIKKGILAELAFQKAKGLRENYTIFFDKRGDGGADVMDYDVKSIPYNGKYLILNEGEIYKAKKYAAIKLSKDLKEAEYMGEISSQEFAKICFMKDHGHGKRPTIFLSDLN